MDGKTILQAQQTDFINRLKSGNLFQCNHPGQHSELTVITGDRLEKLRDFCWDMANKYKRSSSHIRDLFVNNMKGKLGEEVVKTRLRDLLTDVDYEKYQGGDGKVDFTLTADSSIGIQVKARQGQFDLEWSISQEEINKNAVLVCILIQESVNEAQNQYHLVLAGFLPTNMTTVTGGEARVKINDLLYSGGLRSYLESLTASPAVEEDIDLYSGGLRSYLESLTASPVKEDINLYSWELQHTLTGHGEVYDGEDGEVYPYYGEVYSVAFSPDGRTLASGSRDDTIKLWDVATRRLIATLTGNSYGVYSVAFSPDGQTLASGGYQTIKLWDVATGASIATLTGHSNEVHSVAFSPNGQTLASAIRYNTIIKLSDVATGRSIATLKGHSDSVWSVAFSPDGQTLASGSWDKTIKLWDVAIRQEIATLKGHSNEVRSVAFSPNGQTLASGSWDKTIKLWDVATQEEIATLTGHSNEVFSVAFSPDGRTLASGSGDNTIKFWQRR
ncbi:WD40 repeat domain-containing protein [Anabaenopsis tanganyikae CS-531]|uniref:WD40 repeat domain-containing protein n=1 Tax=Anabaenopsis tanganyikae CS-531 TaxID=2785304 RepID=A0ABT6KGP3_9CYAN|nr:WD40 repeat domain-containing protein [Anabaenopsis tanganyikae]MDH6107067.1 WD40 repeat domain-containing protein [Anabaenopsis tanganyikae CS-531]